MKLYERIENNNFDEIDRNRAIELIESGNGHLVYNENYFKLQKENEELRKKLNEENKRCMILAIEKQDYFEKYRYHLQQNERLTKEFSNVIPVQKVKDKIKEIGEKIKYEENEKVVIYLHKQKNILQELLKESEK